MTKSRRRAVWIVVVILSTALVLLWLRPQPQAVDTVEVMTGPLETTIDAEGMTRVRERYDVASPVSGRLERITVHAGDAVQQGAVLARVRPLPLDPASVSQARARLAATEAARHEAQSRLAQADDALQQSERSTGRLRVLAHAGSLSADDMERAELQLAADRREREAALARVQSATAEVTIARTALLGTEPDRSVPAVIRAPASGQVLHVLEQSERVVAAGTPLLRLGDAATLEIVTDVLSTDAVKIARGAAMRVLDWGGTEELPARVRTIEPGGFTKISALGVEEQRVSIIGELIRAAPALGDSYRVQVRIVTWSEDSVLKVPNGALFRDGADWFAYVVERGRARLRRITIGHRGKDETEIVSGLADGEPVIIYPSERLQPDSRVRAASTGRQQAQSRQVLR